MYCLNMYRGNARDGYNFHQQNNDKRIKANKGPRFVCVVEWLHKELFSSFLEIFIQGKINSAVSDFTWLKMDVTEYVTFQND